MKLLGYNFYMKTNIWGDFQICISVPLKSLNYPLSSKVREITNGYNDFHGKGICAGDIKREDFKPYLKRLVWPNKVFCRYHHSCICFFKFPQYLLLSGCKDYIIARQNKNKNVHYVFFDPRERRHPPL